MKKNKEKKIPRESGSYIKFLLILGFVFSASCLIVGAVLTGVYFKNFDTYLKLLSSWKGGPGFQDYINSHNTNYETYKNESGTTWVYASYSLFTVGIVFLVVGLITLGLFIFLWKRKKESFSKGEKHKRVSEPAPRESIDRKESLKKVLVKSPNLSNDV
ncbi:hypothetical protein D8X55_00870 [Malacoplasma penetrans]|uniref:Uncharacterized protein n=1 Tax=Malacoplasma penetrans (strain HF-2) TaxID=272633 RepID=Q8EVW4_MALP2|nr:hypothetical protein [Malacoplasma penetrans]RXY97237.1 hypothetical protein D8X55_00870 [Malacoplasma penetrans]BAC44235.1 hypothetical protein [Malacoplasma penetrans HF-2]